jgi:UDP-N-acetylglucosamine 2-epimerase (non-hydrolysing)
MAAVHVLPSWRETPGLVSFGSSSGGLPWSQLPLIDAHYFGELARYCYPNDHQSIWSWTRLACAAIHALRQRVLTEFTWERPRRRPPLPAGYYHRVQRMKILIVIGTRPEAIKMAPVIRALQSYTGQAEVSVCSTGQHRQMLDQVLSLFHIRPDFDLELMSENQTPSQVAAGVLNAIDPLLAGMQPDWMLVQGDTTTVMAATIGAFHRKVRVAHVEAGLRTYDRENPFPEEMNRVVADHVSDLHFAPTHQARAQLLAEGIQAGSIFVTGNTVIDALLGSAAPLTERPTELVETIIAPCHGCRLSPDFGHAPPQNQGANPPDLLRLRYLAQTRPDFHIVTGHRNPNIWEPVHELLGSLYHTHPPWIT